MEIELDGKNSEKEKNREGDPGAYPGPSEDEEENPESKKGEEGDPGLREKGKIKMARIDAQRVDGEDRNERKAKGATHHLRPRRLNLSGGRKTPLC